MKITVKIGALFALGWVLVKMIFHVVGISESSIVPTIFINMFLLLSSIAVGLYLHKKQEGFKEGNALSDIKSCMTVGFPYTVLVVIFIYFYYSSIHPDFVNHMIAEKLNAYKIGLENPHELKLIRASNEAFEVMTKEDIYKEMEKSTRSTISAFSITTISMLGMILLSTVYSILVTVIYRKVLLRGVR
jgi:hypothetical protein